MATTIKMPQLGESVTEGTIERWLVAEGDTVEQYDPLFEVVTDKVNAEVPAEIAGIVTKIIVPNGETVAVGTPVAEIDADGAGAQGEAPAAAAQPDAEAQPEAGADAGAQAVEQQESAPAAADTATPEPEPEPEPQPEPEPAKADAEAEAEPEPEPEPEPNEQAGQAPAASAQPPVESTAKPESDGAAPSPSADGAASRMTPAVRRLVREHGVDVAQLKGSGAGGRVTRDDVLAFIDGGAQGQTAAPESVQKAPSASQAEAAPAAPAAAQAPAPAPVAQAASVPSASGGDTEIALSQMRKAIARKMTQVKQTVPHAYTVIEVDMTSVVRWREANTMAYKAREGTSLSYVAVVVKAVTETLRRHPTLNSQFADDKIILKQAMNIGIAVAIDNGLIVPVIHDADQLSISGVNSRIRDISTRAHSGKLRLDELQGGTFTVKVPPWSSSSRSLPPLARLETSRIRAFTPLIDS